LIVQRREKRKPTKFEVAMQGFTGFLGEETKKTTDTSISFQKQLLTLETKRLQFEKEEREREQQHEMRMMHMFGNLINQSTQPPQPSNNSPVYTNLTNSNRSLGFEYSLYGHK
ncbi:Hypothetical predicted protein, partial [Paramuricea clavata]